MKTNTRIGLGKVFGERGEPEYLESYYSSAGQLSWRNSWNDSAENVSHLLFDAGPTEPIILI